MQNTANKTKSVAIHIGGRTTTSPRQRNHHRITHSKSDCYYSAVAQIM